MKRRPLIQTKFTTKCKFGLIFENDLPHNINKEDIYKYIYIHIVFSIEAERRINKI